MSKAQARKSHQEILDESAKAYQEARNQAEEAYAQIMAQADEALIEALKQAEEAFASEQPPLTKTQQDILGLVALGRRNGEIAEALSIPRKKVSNHVSDLLLRLGAKNRPHAVTIAVREGLIKPELSSGEAGWG